jgi:hypothetical protein
VPPAPRCLRPGRAEKPASPRTRPRRSRRSRPAPGLPFSNPHGAAGYAVDRGFASAVVHIPRHTAIEEGRTRRATPSFALSMHAPAWLRWSCPTRADAGLLHAPPSPRESGSRESGPRSMSSASSANAVRANSPRAIGTRDPSRISCREFELHRDEAFASLTPHDSGPHPIASPLRGAHSKVARPKKTLRGIQTKRPVLDFHKE